jgi:hypothetical protein
MYYGKTLINNCITWIISLVNMNWIELKTLKFWQKLCFIIIDMYANYLCDHQNGFWENLFFGSPEKLRKCSCYTIIIKQRIVDLIERKIIGNGWNKTNQWSRQNAFSEKCNSEK